MRYILAELLTSHHAPPSPYSSTILSTPPLHPSLHLCLPLSNLQMLQTKLNRGLVPERAHATNDRDRLVAKPALVAPLLARMHVADVHLDKGDGDAQQRVAQRDRVVREGGRVDHDGVDALRARRVDPVDQRPFVVALEVRERVHWWRGGGVAGCAGGGEGRHLCDRGRFDVCEGRGPVDRGLPRAEQVEVRPVEQQDVLCWHGCGGVGMRAGCEGVLCRGERIAGLRDWD